ISEFARRTGRLLVSGISVISVISGVGRGRRGDDLLAEPDQEQLVARRARAFGLDRAVLGEDALERLARLLEVFAHEDLADERATRLAELLGDGERAHEELVAAGLVADAVARR